MADIHNNQQGCANTSTYTNIHTHLQNNSLQEVYVYPFFPDYNGSKTQTWENKDSLKTAKLSNKTYSNKTP